MSLEPPVYTCDNNCGRTSTNPLADGWHQFQIEDNGLIDVCDKCWPIALVSVVLAAPAA